MLDVVQVREKEFRGHRFKFAEVRGTPADHSSWWSFDDEQALRDRWWHPNPGDTVLDVGAAFGSYALPALACGARVICFSPADFDTELLALNLSLNPELQRRCLVLRDGCYSKDGWFDPDHCVFADQPVRDSSDHDTTQWLQVRSVDSILASRPGIERVNWIKLDVEGAELEVLKGAEVTLRYERPKVLVENHQFHDKAMADKVRQYMIGLGVGYECDGPHAIIPGGVYPDGTLSVSHSFFEAR